MNKLFAGKALIPLILLSVIFFRIPFSDYAFLDETHQLWHNNDGSNFSMFLVQGRLLTGLIIERSFSLILTVAEIKYLRIFSLAGWVIASLIWIYLLNDWKKKIKFDTRIALFMSIFLPCSIPVAISIGWASCIEIFMAFMAGLLSGHILFCELFEQEKRKVFYWKMIPMFALALCALFLYQTAFGAFLLPFFLYFVTRKTGKPYRTVLTGASVYLAISLVYFLLFKYSLKEYGVIASDRTDLSIQPLKKLSFFFSHPLAQAFSFNFLYNLRGIASQVFYPLMLALWVITVLTRKTSLIIKLQYILMVMALLALIYLPVLLARENFSSYRTMHCLSLAGAFLLTDALLGIIKKERVKNLFIYGFATVISLVAFYNFNVNFILPLEKEYTLTRSYIRNNFSEHVKQIYFIRPPESLFYNLYAVKVYKDEFGVPSTYKDWTPEPLVKQIIFEMINNKEAAERIEIINLAYDQKNTITIPPNDVTSLLVDIEALSFNRSVQ